MQLEKIPLSDTRSFSSFFLDYISGSDSLKSFYNLFPNPENFSKQIQAKSSFPQSSRAIITSVLQRQYSSVTTTELVKNNIASLQDSKTFTVTTGHQLNIFTGPLYFIFKIVTVINTCKTLSKLYPDCRFVPVYWMASEDHDFEEISYFRLYGKKYQWETAQTGAVGRFNPKELDSILKELPGDTSLFRDAYLKNKTLANAARVYVNSLFGDQGIVSVDADDHELKNLLRPVMKADLFDHTPFALVEKDTEKLKSLGYHTQVNAREINFFYLDSGVRDRIENEGDAFKVVNHEIKKTREEISQLLETSPEKFSPNVVLRPLYQEIILPNLAYVGGPSELVYWLQLKSVFGHFQVPFPILMPRNFGMIIDHTLLRKFEKTDLDLKDFFEEKNYLFNHWTLKNSVSNLTLGPAMNVIRKLFSEIHEQAGKIDQTLLAHVDARGKQSVQQLEIIEKKMLRAEKRRHAEKLNQIEAVKDSLFPGGTLQERVDNFLNFYQQNPNFIHDLLNAFDPFDYKMHVLKYHD